MSRTGSRASSFAFRTHAAVLRNWLQLARIQTAPLTAVAPVFGALAVRPDLDLGRLAALFGIGLMSHLYGFVLNEVLDAALDRRSPELVSKPLVTGNIARGTALTFAVLQVPLALMTNLWLVGPAQSPLIVMLASIILATAYNLKGKHARIPPLADLALGLAVGLMIVYGALAAGGLSPLVLGLAGLSVLQITFNNGIEGGLKDLDADTRAGVRTTAMWLGATWRAGQLVLTTRLKLYTLGVKALALFIAVSQIYQCGAFGCGALGYSWLLTQVVGFSAAVMLLATLREFLNLKGFVERGKLKRLASRHEIATYALAVAVAAPQVGFAWSVALLAVPVGWFITANFLLYRRLLEPNV